jgi:hypothetical protein
MPIRLPGKRSPVLPFRLRDAGESFPCRKRFYRGQRSLKIFKVLRPCEAQKSTLATAEPTFIPSGFRAVIGAKFLHDKAKVMTYTWTKK